jgi:hypothetical protein
VAGMSGFGWRVFVECYQSDDRLPVMKQYARAGNCVAASGSYYSSSQNILTKMMEDVDFLVRSHARE